MDDRRKRLLYRATHRGTKEADRLVGGFAEACLADLSPSELDAFEVLLDESDVDIVDWILGRRPAEARDTAILGMIINFKNRM